MVPVTKRHELRLKVASKFAQNGSNGDFVYKQTGNENKTIVINKIFISHLLTSKRHENVSL